jgi:predicted nucleic acid-binding protein
VSDDANTDRYLLDTSAIMALMEDEGGADRVEEVLRRSEVIIPFPVLLETYYISLQEQSEAVADERYALLRHLSVTEIWSVDEPALLTAARLKVRFRVSFADALIAAFAVRSHAVLVHKDPELEVLADRVRQEPLPYK